MTEVISCNFCGECCKQGGSCALRPWNPFRLPAEFEGTCDLLTEANECSVMLLLQERGLWEQSGMNKVVTGVCNFVELRLPRPNEETPAE